MSNDEVPILMDPEIAMVPDTTTELKDDNASTATGGTTQQPPELPEDSTAATATPPEAQTPSLRKLFNMARPEHPMLALAFVLMVAAEATGLIIPLILADAYDVLIEGSSMNDINHLMGIVLLVYGAGMVAGFFRASMLGVIGERMVARLRRQLYASILSQEIAFFDEHKSGELVSRLGSDTSLLQQVISQSIPEAAMGVIKTIVAIGLMFYISPLLAAVSIVSVFLIFMVAMPLGKLLGSLSKAYQNVLGEAQTYSTEAFGSMRTVQAFAAESKEIQRFGRRIGNPDDFPWWYPTTTEPSTYRVGFFKAMTTAGFYIFIFGAGFGFLYVSLWYGFYLVIDGQMTLGDLTAFQSYIFTIGFGLGGAASHFAKVFEGLGASGRVFFLLERIPTIPKPPSDEKEDEMTTNSSKPVVTPLSMTGDIEFCNVSFAYPSRADILVLNDFSLKIPANTTTALVGSSGAGKSTVVALLQRFYDVASGRITVDGMDLERLDLKWLRRHIGYVQQEPQLFGLSIRENLLYGVEREDEITQEDIEQACRDANAYDFIMSWPKGFETLVGGTFMGWGVAISLVCAESTDIFVQFHF
jgi:ABC-type multidrug transport system fused ATPase/permease subunit